MLEQLVITLREGVEAALIVAIALAYLRKVERTDLFRVVYAALASAVAVSLIGAVVLYRFRLDEDKFEGWIMIVASVFVGSMVYWMARTAKSLRHEIEHRMGQLLDASTIGLFFFVFLMVVREGIETVLILSAVSLNTTELLAWLGSVIGLALAVAFGVAFVKGAVRINLQRFFRVTSAILIFIAVQLLLTGLHELSEAGTLPSSRQEMAIVGRLVRNETFFFVVVLGLAGLLLVRERRSAASERVPGGERTAAGAASTQSPAARATSVAEQRKQNWMLRRARFWNRLAYSFAFGFLIVIAAESVYMRSVQAAPQAQPAVAQNGVVRLPVSEVADGNFHWFEAATASGPVRFFAMRRPNGSIAMALDACQICGAQGYYPQGKQLHCRNCDAPINIESIGTAGGCNPIPFAYRRSGDDILIDLPVLEAQAPVFARH